jgi:hypothetical protein
VTGLSGTGLVADDLYLLAHDDRTGRPLLPPRPLGIGLAGGLLAELMLDGWVGLRPDGAVMIGEHVPREAVAGQGLVRQIAAEPRPQPVRDWLRFWAQTAALDVAGRLEHAGYLQQVRGWVPWRGGRWVPTDPDWAFAPMVRVRSALDPARRADAQAVVLAGLADASGLGFRLDQYLSPGRSAAPAVARLPPGLREVIAQTQATVSAAVLSHRT